MNDNTSSNTSRAILLGHRTVTESAISTFGWITGDYSRIHYDRHFAAQMPLETIFSHGLLGASWALGMASRFFPETLSMQDSHYCLSEMEVNFVGVVALDDTVALSQPDWDNALQQTKFELLNQKNKSVTHGRWKLALTDSLVTAAEPFSGEELDCRSYLGNGSSLSNETLYADDMLTLGPCGELSVRTLSEADVVNFASFTSDLNPLYLNAQIAGDTALGQRIVPPMLVFCLCFARWLTELLAIPMPDSGSAGHLRDRWKAHRAVFMGDTLRMHHRPSEFRQSNSQPEQALVLFSMDVVNQHNQRVLSGDMLFLMPCRSSMRD